MARILVVDDSEDFLNLVGVVLRKTNHSVVAVTDPRDALEKFQKDRFDLVLTDINMPGGVSGFNLVKTLRRIPERGSVPIALLTGRKDKGDVRAGVESGADDYIVKPIDPPLFLATVESLLQKSQASKVRFAQGVVQMDAQWDSSVHILNVNEKGMTLWADLKPPLEAIIKLKSDFFQRLGIEAPPLRVLACHDDRSQPRRYFIGVGFIGLNDAELQKIRMWVNAHAIA